DRVEQLASPRGRRVPCERRAVEGDALERGPLLAKQIVDAVEQVGRRRVERERLPIDGEGGPDVAGRRVRLRSTTRQEEERGGVDLEVAERARENSGSAP